uniref:J domain-containing protein n=1 Tax=Noctiluca scintillans TaxID=2966 RepID=A0A7S0ZZJ6_NOCSC|mmetsp:Transcript_25709/g.67273  ORF Transcript_25709/g.67273 Transcript_25709/m.67273 type:complete len:550 (+) Transcript_25709:50-1699(+)
MSGDVRGFGGPAVQALDDETEEGNPSAEELLKEAGDAFGEVFSVQAPRDVFAGLWSGTKCMLTGVGLAISCLIAQPLEGFRDSGLFGGLRGLTLGLCSGFFFSLTGFCTGLFQTFRGAVNTPRAICAVSQGLCWDSEVRSWNPPSVYSLAEEAARVLVEDEDSSSTERDDGRSNGHTHRSVADMHYYDQLQLHPGASQQEVRRAYFHMSKKWHPDKTSAQGAKERFQAISEAYQVLSDPDRRRAYDSKGRKGAGEGFVDAKIFFGVLFGSDALEQFIGKLRLSDVFGSEGLNGDEGDDREDTGLDFLRHFTSSDKSEAQQTRRQVQLSVDLAARLEEYVHGGDREMFCSASHAEVRQILQRDPSLACFVSEIGWVYKNRAEWHLAQRESRLGAFGLKAISVQLRRSGREIRQKANTAKLAVRSYLKLRRMVNDAEEEKRKDDDSDDEDQDLSEWMASALPTFMETFWSLTTHDITGTLDGVIERVLTDGGVGSEDRFHRAVGLRERGVAFLAEAEAIRAADSAAGDDERKRKRFEEAFIACVGSGGSDD